MAAERRAMVANLTNEAAERFRAAPGPRLG
jgi:hypothetical protein